MAQRHVSRLARLHGERHADQLGALRIEAGGFGIEGKTFGRLQTRQPALEIGLLQQGLVLGLGLDRTAFWLHLAVLPRRLGLAQQLVQPLLELQLAVEGDQRLAVRFTGHQVTDLDVQRHVDLDRSQLVGHEGGIAMLLQLGAQRLGTANRQPGDLVEVLVEPLEPARDAVEQATCRLLAHAWHARNVVDLVAHQREEVDDQFRADAELGLHALDVIDAAGHGVDQGDVRADQLGHVLVAGGDHHITAQRRALPRQGADDIVCLDPFHAQQRQPQCTDAGMQRLDLHAQVVGHRRAVRLVVLEQRVAKGRTLGVENHCERAVRILPAQAKQHVQHTLDRTGRLAGRGGQRRQCVEGAVQVGRTVHQDEGGLAHERNQPFRRARS